MPSFAKNGSVMLGGTAQISRHVSSGHPASLPECILHCMYISYVTGPRLLHRRNGALKVKEESMKKLRELMPEYSEFESILQVATIWIADEQKKARASKYEKG